MERRGRAVAEGTAIRVNDKEIDGGSIKEVQAPPSTRIWQAEQEEK